MGVLDGIRCNEPPRKIGPKKGYTGKRSSRSFALEEHTSRKTRSNGKSDLKGVRDVALFSKPCAGERECWKDGEGKQRKRKRGREGEREEEKERTRGHGSQNFRESFEVSMDLLTLIANSLSLSPIPSSFCPGYFFSVFFVC